MNYTYAPEIKVASIGTLSVLDIVTNSIVIAVIAKYPQLREDRTNLFMLSLMISDILYGTLVMPISAVLCSSEGQSVLAAMPYLANVHMVCVRWLATTSLNSLSWVTMCKMIAITKPFVYDRHINSYRCGIIIALIWSIGFLIGIATLRVDIHWNHYFCLSRITASSAADSITTLSFFNRHHNSCYLDRLWHWRDLLGYRTNTPTNYISGAVDIGRPGYLWATYISDSSVD